MNLKFSVIIPAYNSEKYIVDALDSVYQQTAIQNIGEVIVVNDGSTDKTQVIVSDYQHKNMSSSPLILINQKNLGVSAARNTGVKAAHYEWIAFLDSDDEWYPNKTQTQLEIINQIGEQSIDCLGGSFHGNELKIIWKTYKDVFKANITQVCLKNFPQPSTVLIKKEVFNKVGGFDELQKYAEDGKFFLEVCYRFNMYYDPKQIIEFGHGKRGFGTIGLSGNLKGMYRGNIDNIKLLYKKERIGYGFYIFLRIFYFIKYIRRIIICKL